MAHWTKSFRRYERHFLLGLVILLLGSFSVTGALRRCSDESTSASKPFGGSFQVSPQRRMEISDAEMAERVDQWWRYSLVPGSDVTLLYAEDFGKRKPDQSASAHIKRAWAHTVLAEAAKEAGYRVGVGQRASAIQQALARARAMGAHKSAESYERFLTELYQGPAGTFEKTLSDIVAQDEFLAPLIEPARYAQTYAEAYEAWKHSAERVGLRYLAVEATSLVPAVKDEEDTKQTISKQEDVLAQVMQAAKDLRSIQKKVQDHKAQRGALPATLDVLAKREDAHQLWALTDAQLKDPWGHPWVYRVEGETFTLASTGPSGPAAEGATANEADDLTPAFALQLDAHRGLSLVANALLNWHRDSDPKAWPETLDRLTQPAPRAAPTDPDKPAPPRLPPLQRLEQDPWGKEYQYVPGAAGAPPRLFSSGPDQQPGTADDIPATIEEDRSRVLPGPAFAPFLDTSLRDAWQRPLVVQLNPNGSGWEVSSLGKDGVVGAGGEGAEGAAASDDLVGGNRAEFDRFWNQGPVRSEFRLPVQRQFKALVLHLPLVSDARLRRLWEDFPELRPTKADEEKLFEKQWRVDSGPLATYSATDPGDPERGHGAAFAKRIRPKAERYWLVPDKKVFEVAAPPEPAPPPPAAPAPAPAPAPPPDPQRKEYEEKGWREVMLKQEFLERVLAAQWAEVVKSHEALRDWEKSGVRVTPRPPVTTIEDVFAKLEKYQPTPEERARGEAFLEWVKVDAPVPVKTLDELPEIGDPNLSQNPLVGSLRERAPASIPIALNERQTKLLFFNESYQPERMPDLVKDDPPGSRAKVFARFVESRAMAKAELELRAFQRDVEKRQAERKEGETDDAIWDAALAAWKAARPGVVVHDERTGMFIGPRPPQRRASEPPAKDAPPPTDEQKAARARELRRALVREQGYLQVPPPTAPGESATPRVGTFGKKTLTDPTQGEEATHAAYLVRIAEHAYPSKAEFSPRAYAGELRRVAFGDVSPGARSFPRGNDDGTYPQALAAYLENMDDLRVRFDLRTKANLDQLAR